MPRDDLLRVTRDIATDSRFHKIRLLVISREYINIENVMQPISASMSMSNPLVEEDIRLYVRSQLKTNRNLKRWPQHLKDEVVKILPIKSKGM